MTTLRTTQQGLAFIRVVEGDKLKAYYCLAGIKTISVGVTTDALHDADVRITYKDGVVSRDVLMNRAITQEESRRVFAAVVDYFENAIEAMLGAKSKSALPHEFDALVSLAWNIGLGAFGRSSVLRRYLAGDKAGAAQAFLLWDKAKVNGVRQTVRSLTRRREAERLMFLGLGVGMPRTQPASMPQAVSPPTAAETAINPKPLAKSRTVGGAATAGTGGAVVAGEAIAKASTELERADGHLSAGTMIGLALGALIIAGALVALYARWDDAGRPWPRWPWRKRKAA